MNRQTLALSLLVLLILPFRCGGATLLQDPVTDTAAANADAEKPLENTNAVAADANVEKPLENPNTIAEDANFLGKPLETAVDTEAVHELEGALDALEAATNPTNDVALQLDASEDLLQRITEFHDRFAQQWSKELEALNSGNHIFEPLRFGDSIYRRMRSELRAMGQWKMRALLESPEVEVEENADGTVKTVRAQLPGVEAKDVRVELRGGQLLLSAQHSSQSATNGGSTFTSSSFYRTFPVQPTARNEDVRATFDRQRGMLIISVAERQAALPNPYAIPIHDEL